MQQDDSLELSQAREQVAKTCLYGVDLDPIAVALAQRVLWLVVGNPQLPLDFMEDRLRCGDALVGEGAQPEPEQVFPSEPFHWHRAFPEVFDQGGFDALIGNPPFRNAVEHRMSAAHDQKAWWRARWPASSGSRGSKSVVLGARNPRLCWRLMGDTG